MSYSVSYTTREPRDGEKAGEDYHFVDRETFQQGLSRGLWAEWAEVHGSFYGTSAPYLEEEMSAGKDILLDLDVQGALQLLDRYSECITVFIMPPSMAVLKQRLESRGTDSEGEITKRLFNAEREIAQKDRYRHIIINDDLPDAIRELVAIVRRYREA